MIKIYIILTSGNTGVVAFMYPHFFILFNFYDNKNLTTIHTETILDKLKLKNKK